MGSEYKQPSIETNTGITVLGWMSEEESKELQAILGGLTAEQIYKLDRACLALQNGVRY